MGLMLVFDGLEGVLHSGMELVPATDYWVPALSMEPYRHIAGQE